MQWLLIVGTIIRTRVPGHYGDSVLALGEHNDGLVATAAAWAVPSAVALTSLAYGLNETAALWLVPTFAVVIIALVATSRLTLNETSDVLNPAVIVVVVALLRFAMPWLLQALRGDTDEIALISILDLTPHEWTLGLLLAAIGTCSFLGGWLLTLRTGTTSLASTRISTTPAYVAFAVGLGALVVFVISNASLDVVRTGAFRGIEVREGTGYLNLLSRLAIAGSVVAGSAYAAHRGFLGRWFALGPPLVCSAAFFVLGGRGRALTAIACGILLVGVLRPRRAAQDTRFLLRRIVAGTAVLVVFAFVGMTYRGVDRVTGQRNDVSVSTFVRYASDSMVIDVGTLHSLALAKRAGPGELGGQTYAFHLLWPASQALGMPGRSSGLFLVEQTFKRDMDWGLHATGPGDGYVNLGLMGAVTAPLSLGVMTGVIYRRYRCGRLHPAVYALALAYLLKVYFEGFEKWSEGVMVVTAAWLLVRWGSRRASARWSAESDPRMRIASEPLTA